jgi:iron complex outermembrane receptor protein
LKDHRALALASVSLISIAAPAFAQTVAPAATAPAADNAPAAQIGEVIVQARRRDERLQDVPLVVNAVTSKELDQLNIRDMKDIAPIVPGLTLTNGANGIGSVATLRGVNFDVNSSGNNGTVEFYLNDEPITSDVVLQSMYDIGQIEVLRGPQGTLRGRASPSGSITVTTQRPDLYSYGGYASFNINDIGGQNLQGAVNLPLIQDKLAIRIAGLVDEGEANRVNSINDPGVKPLSRTESGRISLRFKPIDTLDIDFSYQHFVSRTQAFDQVESADLADPTQAASPVPLTANDRTSVEYTPREFRHQYDIYNLRAQWEFAGMRLNYVGAFNDERTTSADPNDIGAYYAGFGGSASAPNNPLVTGFSTNQTCITPSRSPTATRISSRTKSACRRSSACSAWPTSSSGA